MSCFSLIFLKKCSIVNIEILTFFIGPTLTAFVINIAFPLISTPGAYKILKLLSAVLVRGHHQLEDDVYFKVKGNQQYFFFQNKNET